MDEVFQRRPVGGIWLLALAFEFGFLEIDCKGAVDESKDDFFDERVKQ